MKIIKPLGSLNCPWFKENMLLSYRDPQFWKKFRANHWELRKPTVIRQPFREFPFSEEALLAALKAFETGLRGDDQRSTCLVSVGDAERPPRRPLKELFQHDIKSMAELEQVCARVFQKKRFGLMITHFQMVDPGIWGPISAFIQDARQNIDSAFPRAFLDLFYGNYLSSFTGLHKDTQEIFAFVVRGKKRILAWPFDYFVPKVKGLGPGARYFHMRLAIDYRKYRKDAVVLDAQAGDVIYWPSDHWHVAEPRSDKFSAMVSLGLFKQDIASAQYPNVLRSQEISHSISGTRGAQQLRWLTGLGFELGGPMAEAPKGANKTARLKTTVAKNTSSLLIWKIDQSRHRILVSANGHSITLPHSARLVKLIEQLARGKKVTVSGETNDIHGSGAKIFETHWDRKCQLKTRQMVSNQEPGLCLVDWLMRAYSLTRLS